MLALPCKPWLTPVRIRNLCAKMPPAQCQCAQASVCPRGSEGEWRCSPPRIGALAYEKEPQESPPAPVHDGRRLVRSSVCGNRQIQSRRVDLDGITTVFWTVSLWNANTRRDQERI